MKRKRRSSAQLLEAMEQAEDQRLEIENRIRNLFWTVNGDYSLNIKPDVDTFLRSKPLALYDAIKQGAFAKDFDVQALALYTLKKRVMGADEALLTELTQLCVDAAAYPRASRERSGIRETRSKAFRDLLDTGYFRGTLGQIRKTILCRFLREEITPEPEILAAVEQIEALGAAQSTDEIIVTIDALYNSLVDPDFEAKHGDLKRVLRVTNQDIIDYRRDLAISDEMMQAALNEYLSIVKEELLRTAATRSVQHRLATSAPENEEAVPEPTPEQREKTYQFIQRQFGNSYLSRLEQERLSRKYCLGLHKRCSLYFTDGILSNPAVKNTQYLRTTMQSMKNETYVSMKQQPIRRSIAALSAMLKQVQIQREDEDSVRSDYGEIVPARLWKLGRTQDDKLFDLKKKREKSDFVVDILIDSSSSQTIRQPQIAAQGYIISQALSAANIPHRVCGFCSYWDYTMIHRFRDYDDPIEAGKNILQFRAFGENRDGLAIRTVCDALQNRPEENKILIILSDGKPNNLSVSRPGVRRVAPYVGEEAIKDTAFEVRKARNNGISVLGIFVGSESDLYAEKKIFGKEFAYTKNISTFSHIVGTYLRRMMEQE